MKSVIKASGLEEEFSSRKIYNTIVEAGGDGRLARRVVNAVKRKYHKNITTEEILEVVLHELKGSPGIRARYDLKRAIMSLGPSGFPFETFFGHLIEHYNYEAKIGNFLRGKKIIHEVDIVAKRIISGKEKNYMIECKYHNEPGTSTRLHPALYTYARFLDLNSLKKNFDLPWLVTNTKCSNDARNYSKGVGLKITSWNYPNSSSLRKLITKKKLYPITIVKSISHATKEKLFSAKIMIAKNLLNYSVEDLIQKTGLSKKEIKKILKEVKEICEIK